MNRRDALKSITLGVGVAATSAVPVLGNSKKEVEQTINKSKNIRVIVCGGGFAGLTTAKYLKQFNPDLEVILIEKNSHFISCPYSNVWLGDVDDVSLRDLSFDYLSASSKFNYEFVNDTIVDINKDRRLVVTNNETYEYDYLVLSTGIEYDYSKLFKDTIKAKKVYTMYPPAMKAGGEHLLLKNKIENFKGGNFIINVPSGIYRCPPAPYERACMIAYYFKTHNIKGKVVLIDPREKPAAKPEGFLSTFNELYKDYIEYLPLSEIKDIDIKNSYLTIEQFDKRKLDYISQKLYFSDANIIPNMKPSKLVEKTGLELTPKGWAKLKEPTFESVTDNKIIVVGDSGGHPYPKSGHMANSCGYIAAKHLAYKTLNRLYDPADELPSNICYSMVNGDPLEGLTVYHSVEYDTEKGLLVSSRATLKRDIDSGEVIKHWYNNIMSDMFGSV